MPKTRPYELQKRAERMDATRRRIVEAASELHRTVGPAATTVTEVARRAGVERVTVYNHFPDDASLFSACSAHWRSLHPAPDPAEWRGERSPRERVRHALGDLYRWYRDTEPMTANVLRDAELVPALAPIIARGAGRYMREVQRDLIDAFEARGSRREAIAAAIRAATDFHFWRAISSLGDARAAELATRLVDAAGRID